MGSWDSSGNKTLSSKSTPGLEVVEVVSHLVGSVKLAIEVFQLEFAMSQVWIGMRVCWMVVWIRQQGRQLVQVLQRDPVQLFCVIT